MTTPNADGKVQVKASAGESVKAGLFGSLGVFLGGTVGVILISLVVLFVCVACCTFTVLIAVSMDSSYSTTAP